MDQSGDELPASVGNQNERISKLKQLQKKLSESEKGKINTTDANAVFMKTSNGIKTSYNGLAAVDQEHQVIIAADVTNQPADVEQLIPMIDQGEHNASDYPTRGTSHTAARKTHSDHECKQRCS